MTATKLEVWEWLHENGPSSYDGIRDEFGESGVECIRDLHRTGHVSNTIDRRIEANDTDELVRLPESLGAGLGDTYSGDVPDNTPP